MGLCMLFKGGDGLQEDGATLQLVSERGPLFIWKYQWNIVSFQTVLMPLLLN